jgi:transposase
MYSNDTRIIALTLYDKLLSLRKVSELLGIHYSTISRWVISRTTYKSEERKSIHNKLDGDEINNHVKLFIHNNPFCTLLELKNTIKLKFEIIVSSELVRLYLKKHNYTRKKVKYYSKPSNDNEKLEAFLELRNKYIEENRFFVSIDETSFGRNYAPAIGYSQKDKKYI